MSSDAFEVEISEPAILITVNQLYREGMSAEELYEITRGNWVVNPQRSNKAQYAFAVYKGIIREVYEIEAWSPAKARNPEQKTEDRWRFDGKVAHHLRHYVGGSISKTKGAQNPIQYINC